MWLELSYQFLGGLGIFFFGMKTLSEALQSVASDLIKRVINALTSNVLIAVGVGALVTGIVQSSSVTTVMVVGLVNANLMALSQAIGVIFGANIGTTITGWIIAIKVGKFGPLFIGLGIFPYMFSKRSDWRSVGRMLIAFGFIFMGLDMMSEAFKPLRSHRGFMDLLVFFSADNYITFLACVAMGAALTCIIQSSSAMLGVTIALASTNTITFQTAAALVLGENIGTTITALLASVGANSVAKRAARAHALFNLFGVLWLSPVFWQYLKLIDWLIPGMPDFVGPDGEKPYIAAHIASAHTMFNCLNTLVFIPFVQPLARLVTWLTPPPREKEKPHLKFLSSRIAIGSSTGLALATAEKELINLAVIVRRSLLLARRYVLLDKPDARTFARLEKYETITDNIQGEVTVFLCKIQEGALTTEQSSQAYAYIRAADELESVADYCLALAKYRNRLEEMNGVLSTTEKDDIASYLKKISSFYRRVERTIGSGQLKLAETYALSKRLKIEGDTIWEAHRKRLEQGVSPAVSGMIFSDLMVGLRKIKGHIVNLAEALATLPMSDQPA